jgi:nitrate/nitrite-specific signal transduction histidine kinase
MPAFHRRFLAVRRILDLVCGLLFVIIDSPATFGIGMEHAIAETEMDRRRFLTTAALAAGSTFSGFTAWAQITHINDAINKSGRQRMLSQRMAKAYLQVGQGIDADHSKKILTESIALFEHQLGDLKTFAPTPEIKAELQEVDAVWSRYKDALASAQPNPQDARKVLVLNEEVLKHTNAATAQLEKSSGTVAAKHVNMSGRERMLSQRMAKFYQAINWGIASPDMKSKLLEAREEFVAALAQLSNSPKNTPEIKRELELAQTQWVFFDNALHAESDNGTLKKQLAVNVATTSERILEVMDHITGMYEKLG